MAKLFSEIPCLQGERVTLRALTPDDAEKLRELSESEEVYRYLPTFLFEQQYEDKAAVISRLYDECLQTSLILGVYLGEEFCGLAEFYGYRPAKNKASVGYRLLPEHWGKGVATEALGLMVKYLLEETDVEVITASTMLENHASARVLQKNGFRRVMHGAWEDWGFEKLAAVDKWLLTGVSYRRQYRFHS